MYHDFFPGTEIKNKIARTQYILYLFFLRYFLKKSDVTASPSIHFTLPRKKNNFIKKIFRELDPY